MPSLERQLNDLLLGSPPKRRSAPTTRYFAIFPCGTEVEIKRTDHGFKIADPQGRVTETSLRDLKHFVGQDHPGTRFIKKRTRENDTANQAN